MTEKVTAQLSTLSDEELETLKYALAVCSVFQFESNHPRLWEAIEPLMDGRPYLAKPVMDMICAVIVSRLTGTA